MLPWLTIYLFSMGFISLVGFLYRWDSEILGKDKIVLLFSLTALLVPILLFFGYDVYKNGYYNIDKDKKSNYFISIGFIIASMVATFMMNKLINGSNESNASIDGESSEIKNAAREILKIWKYAAIILVMLGLCFGILWVSKTSTVFGTFIAFIVSLICVIGFLIVYFVGTQYDKPNNNGINNKLFRHNKKIFIKRFIDNLINWITSTPIFKLIKKMCLYIYYKFLELKESTRDTPKNVFVILAIQVILIVSYFLFPYIKKLILVDSSGFNEDDIENIHDEKKGALMNQILQNKRDIEKIKSGASNISEDTWEAIFENSLYVKTPNKIRGLSSELIEVGVLSVKDPEYERFNRWSKIYRSILGKKILSLEGAMTYIQTNAETILQKEAKNKALLENVNNIDLVKDDDVRVLLKEPIYIERKTPIKVSDEIRHSIQNYNYSISAWFYLHQTAPNSRKKGDKYVSILNYGDKPNILYNSNKNRLKITMKRIFKDEKTCEEQNSCSDMNNSDIVEIFSSDKIKLQRWNNVVVNCESGIVDIFINGKMVTSNNKIIPTSERGLVTVGSDGGASGGVCNMMYFPFPLGIYQIEYFYKMLRFKTPPII